MSGTGFEVVRASRPLAGSVVHASATTTGNTIVWAYELNGTDRELMANEIGSFTDLQEPFPTWAGPTLLSVEADGTWDFSTSFNLAPAMARQ